MYCGDILHFSWASWVPSKLPITDSVCSHLGKLQLGKFGCTNVSHVCLLNRSKYLGLCSLGLLKSSGGLVAVCMHRHGSRGGGCPPPTLTGNCSVGRPLQTSLKVREGAKLCSRSDCELKRVNEGRCLGFVWYWLTLQPRSVWHFCCQSFLFF